MTPDQVRRHREITKVLKIGRTEQRLARETADRLLGQANYVDLKQYILTGDVVLTNVPPSLQELPDKNS